MISSKSKLTLKHLAFAYTLKQLRTNYFKCNHKSNVSGPAGGGLTIVNTVED